MTDEPPEIGGEPDDEMAARLKEVEDKARRLKGGNKLPDPPDWNYQRPASMRKKPEDPGYQGLGLGLSVAYSLVGCMALGWFIGWLVDKAHGSGGTTGQAIGGLLGCIAGMASAMLMVNRLGGGRD
jgi:F0F1-type ATP synthase assembly protein I